MSTLRTNNLQNPDSSNVNIELTQNGGAVVSGIVTASAGIEGNLTGNATTATTATNALGITTTQITVGDTFLKSNALGLGQTTTAGRNVGINTAIGTIIYNGDVKQAQVYNGSTGWSNLGGGYIEATGGTVSEYQDGSVFYRAHKFANSGQFSVHNAPENAKIDYLLVGGGGSGGTGGPGGRSGGGGGAGLLRYQTNQSISEGSYNITIGAGGVGNINYVIGNPGTASVLELGSTTVTSPGGGAGGGGLTSVNQRGGDGGSGGGGQTDPGGQGDGDTGGSNGSVSPDQGWGNNGEGPINAGGGGGAGQAGGTGRDRDGGDGLSYNITGITTHYAGGGGGADSQTGISVTPYVEPLAGVGGIGGGGDAANTHPARTGDVGGAQHGVAGTGGGGGGAARFEPGVLQIGANGGSGVCVIRYQIGGLSGTAKATGGMISFKDGKVIHQFLSSGEFTVTNPTLTSINYLVVGGGGGGGGDNNNNGAGGGGGLLRYAENQSISTGTYPVVVGAAGASGQNGTGNNPGQGFNGGASTLNLPSAVTSPGGGGGGGQAPSVGREGGSGGGGGGGGAVAIPGNGTGSGGGTPNSVSPPIGWGNNGGQNNGNQPYCAGGGGGAGANGYDGGDANNFPTSMSPLGQLGRGGTGLIYNITGYDVGYAGGGSAGISERGPDIGGGGRGPGGYPTPGPGTAGQVNRGSGGGGGCRTPANDPSQVAPGQGGNGGSGIIVISYPT